MKRFLKLKLILPLVTLIMLASAIAIPFSGKIIRTHAASGNNGVSVLVPATAQWLNTGIQLNITDQLNITATGSWSPSPSFGTWGPDGSPQLWPDNFLNLQDIGSCAFCATTPTPHFAALIGYIGNAPPAPGSYTSTSILPEAQKVFFVGSNFGVSIARAGMLWLNFNDDAYSNFTFDNSGQVTATVLLHPGTIPPPQRPIPLAQIPSSGFIGFLFHQDLNTLGCLDVNDPSLSHQGIDIWTNKDTGGGTNPPSPKGNAVFAPYSGILVAIDDANNKPAMNADGSPSKTASILVIHHGLIGGQQIYTLYAHMANADGSETYVDPGLRTGQTITQGQLLGYQGNAGTAVTNPQHITHLHFEIKTSGQPGNDVDPSPYVGRQLNRCNPGYPAFLAAFP